MAYAVATSPGGQEDSQARQRTSRQVSRIESREDDSPLTAHHVRYGRHLPSPAPRIALDSLRYSCTASANRASVVSWCGSRRWSRWGARCDASCPSIQGDTGWGSSPGKLRKNVTTSS